MSQFKGVQDQNDTVDIKIASPVPSISVTKKNARRVVALYVDLSPPTQSTSLKLEIYPS